MGRRDIDAAVERDMRRKAETEQRADAVPRHSECAVCGSPTVGDPKSSLDFCDNHDIEDFRAMRESMRPEERRMEEEHARRMEMMTER